ncbi:MAG: PQQ-dependent sugar dehydrogenase [Alphaproteobacteria bacterium]|nr:PQQ-dependent sugar dehydrogenase [Alphaproteobacteria bacterium]
MKKTNGVIGLAAVLIAGAAHADAPGMKHEIRIPDLPKPYATPAADNSSQTVARPNGWLPQVPKGFTISIFADHLSDPRWMALAPNGDVFLAEPDSNQIVLLRDADHNGRAEKKFMFASGFDRPHGLAFHNGALYVGDLNAVWKLEYRDGATQAGARTRVTKQDFGGKGGHGTRNIAFDADGALYVAIGSAGNIETNDPPTRASVQRVKADGTLTTYANGLRNPVAIVFSPSNQMWVTVNERDGLGDNLPPDYATHVEAGAFYGWPYAYIGPHPDPTNGAKRPDLVAKTKAPDVLFQAHSAPLGLVFYDGAQFPADYKGDAFVALHGSWNSGNPHGYKVVRIHFAGGKPVGGYEDFITGFWDGKTSPAHVYGRPAGLLVAKDGSVLIADDAGKTVWRVSYAAK